MADTPLHIGSWQRDVVSFVPGHGTRCQVIWAPGVNGGRLHELSASNSDTANIKAVNFAWAKIIATNTAGNTVSITGLNVISRSGGTLDLTGGKLIGGEMMALLDASTVGNRGVMARTTAAAAATLTFAASTFSTNEALPLGARIALLGRAVTLNVPAGAGYTVSPTNILSSTNLPQLADRPDTNAVSSAGIVLVAWPSVAVTASNSLDFHAAWGDN